MSARQSGRTTAQLEKVLTYLREHPEEKAIYFVHTEAMVGYAKNLIRHLAKNEDALCDRLEVKHMVHEQAIDQHLRTRNLRDWYDHAWYGRRW